MNLLMVSALQATVILGAAWVATLALRKASAGVRHTVWLAAVVAVAILPLALSMPQGSIPTAARLVVPAQVAEAPGAVARKLPWLALIWAAGVAFVLGRLIAGLLAAARITRSARETDGVLYSDRASTPMTWGWRRPVVILPAYAQEWTDAERDVVIRHERAHIARHDWLWQMLAGVATAVFWFHPLMWLANFQLRREAEAAVDDCVLSAGVAPSDYAVRLLDVARRGVGAPAAAIAMVRKPELETRVRSILDPARRRAGAGMLVRCSVALAAAALILPVTVTRQIVHAQGKVYKVGAGVSQPKILHKEDPKYTQEAKDAKIEGTVTLKAEITPGGNAENISVVKSLDPGLDANAVTAVSNWRFQPGMKDGEAVTVAVVIEVNFHLL